MERKFLEDMGLEKDKIDKIMQENGADIEKKKKDVTSLQAERDNLAAQLSEVQETLKTFEGKEPEALQIKINNLNQELKDKEIEHSKKLADRDFLDTINKAVLLEKGKDTDLVLAKLDIETLKQSNNQEKDINTAVSGLRESFPYLFEETETKPLETKMKTGGAHSEDGEGGSSPISLKSALSEHYEGE